MTANYATADELLSYIGENSDLNGASVSELDRLLERASDLLDGRAIRTAFSIDRTTGLPSNPAIAAAIRDACCAQVEFWSEVGEESDIDGMAGRQSSVGGMSVTLPGRISGRALDHLHGAGLTGPQTTSGLL